MSDKIGLFAGSFDPVTNGHMDIIKRASKLFDKLYVGIFYNKEKQGFFSVEERFFMLRAATENLPNVQVVSANDSLAVDVAKDLGASFLVRGLRSIQDFTYEASMTYFNHEMAPDLETLYLQTNHAFEYVSSSRVRELIHFRADISPYVPLAVVKEVEKKGGSYQKI